MTTTQTAPVLCKAQANIESIGARVGEYVMIYPTHITVIHDERLDALTDADRANLVRVRIPG